VVAAFRTEPPAVALGANTAAEDESGGVEWIATTKISHNPFMSVSVMGNAGVCGQAAVLGVLLMFGDLAVAQDTATPQPLPSPLTLTQALALADETHPDLDLAQAELAQARARLLATEAESGTRAFFELAPERVEPSTGGGHVDDSRVRLFVSKRLYDFGRSRARETAATTELAGREQGFLDVRQERRLEIMTRFLSVLLADLQFAYENENMAYEYVTYDKVRERHALARVSDVELLEAENRYREALNVRTESEKRQTNTRQMLALALNRPTELPGELARPEFALEREIPEYQTLAERARKFNPRLVALRKEVEAARATVVAERTRRRPMLSAELEAAEYERAIGSRNDVRAALNLRIPLYQGGEDTAAIAHAVATLQARRARLEKMEHDIQKAALDLVQQLETLKIRRETARQRLAFRDLSLEKRRALYEMEVQVTLGDAMTRLTEAQWLAAKADYELVLVWARIDALTGRLIQSQTEAKAP
jgi:outer membrane protein TolC